MSRSADLHLHTSHSDGLRTSREIIDLAVQLDLGIIAISDHDNLAAYSEILPYALEKEITLVPAVELSCSYRSTDVHILAYAFDPDSDAIRGRLQHFRETRSDRGALIVERLRSSGVDIDLARVEEIAGHGAMGRPHVARALLEKGIVSSIQDAFERFLRPGKPGYVDKERFLVDEAVEMIRRAGGVTVVAHAPLYPRWRMIVGELLTLGVDGLEILHPSIDEESRNELLSIARQRDCLRTGGSDDHGIEDRRTIGSIRVPEEWIGSILARVG
ncbi:MAG TPA: PHP domain-containing protein [Thermoanaerobaculia bacterium]|nr:PHP domain-containing protein [Thermoanaerobaculia bacterium]